MNLNLDDDSTHPRLVRLLRKERHDVRLPVDVGRAGNHDAVHLKFAIRENRVFLTHNRRDFPFLHELVLEVHGHHPGILLVRRDNVSKRDMSPADIVRAIRNLINAGVPMEDQLHILNHWR
jgi:predicted nuclease of predicted toxin-antitoxin system